MNGILKRESYQGDRVLWMVTALLLMVSVPAVYSAVARLANDEDATTSAFLFKHLMMIALGFAAMYMVHKVNFKYFSKLSQYLFYISIGLLVMTLLFGVNLNSASRWLRIPFLGINFQTSDFAKVALILYQARMLNLNRTVLHSFKDGVWPALWPALVICGLIFPANFSTAAMLFGICFLMWFIGGIPLRHLGRILGVIAAGAVLVLLLGKSFPNALPRMGTWVKRIENFVQPNSEGNYQLKYAELAIRQGSLLPHGPGTSVTRTLMPHPYSDMIFAFVIEEYGSLFGCLGLLLLYFILAYRAIRNGVKCPKYFGAMTSIGLGILITVQALTNMAVAVGLFPTTGQPLPLVSMGGTTTIINMTALGILIAVSRLKAAPEDLEKPANSSPPNHES